MFDRVEKTPENYFQLKKIPTREELRKYYQEKYFQSGEQYNFEYKPEELLHIHKKVGLKIVAMKKALNFDPKNKPRVLELGVGEGWTLKALKDQGCEVVGLDFSDFAVKHHNPNLLPHMIAGDVEDNVNKLIEKKETFDLIWLDNVLEHATNPKDLLEKCHHLTKPDGGLMIEVPNDFSPVQLHLMKTNQIDKPFWIVEPDHVSYFNQEGLSQLCKKTMWEKKDVFSDFPIEMFLFNENTNYTRNKTVGKSCHLARVNIENFMLDIDVEKSLNLFRSMANLGLGRQIVGIYRRG